MAYSPLAELALVVGQVAAAIACILAVIGSVTALIGGEWFRAFVEGPIAGLVLLSLLVVLLRVQDIGRKT